MLLFIHFIIQERNIIYTYIICNNIIILFFVNKIILKIAQPGVLKGFSAASYIFFLMKMGEGLYLTWIWSWMSKGIRENLYYDQLLLLI